MLEKRKCTVNEQDTTALIFSQKHLEALYLQCLMHRRNAMQEIPELKGLSETCNRIYKLQDVDVLFQCLLMDQMDWEEEKFKDAVSKGKNRERAREQQKDRGQSL